MIRQYERQPIDHATVLVLDDNGTQSLIIEPFDGYKIRKKGDDTYSTMQVGIPMQFLSLLNEYHTVPINEPDEVIEEEDNAQNIIDNLRMIKDNGYGLYMLDKELGARVYTQAAPLAGK